MDSTALYRAFGQRVAARRAEMSLTQAQLADRVDFSRASIANIERGKQNLPLHQVYRLTQALELEDVNILLPSLRSPEPVAHDSVAISEPAGGLSDAARLQIASIFNDMDAQR